MPLTPESRYDVRVQICKAGTDDAITRFEQPDLTYGQMVAVEAATMDALIELGIIQSEALGQMPVDVRDVIAEKRRARMVGPGNPPGRGTVKG